MNDSHSNPVSTVYLAMNIHILPALSDNYMYLIVDPKTNEAGIVDPVDARKVINIVKKENLKLTSILTTHHHYDHAGGNKELFKFYKEKLKVYGGDERVEALNLKVTHNYEFQIGHLHVRCLATPCHTSGHICYYVWNPEVSDTPNVFTGDTLFIAGCGKFFEGTANEMYNSLNILGNLPDETKVFCGHEYTVSNLKFALYVEPNNEHAKSRLACALKKREAGEPTVPSTIGEEKLINPFMRVHESTIQNFATCSDPISVMDLIRKKKNIFKSV